jgi:cell division transport system permease protein
MLRSSLQSPKGLAWRVIVGQKFDSMSQAGKASIKRGKPSYFMAILGVTIVLCLFGLIGLLTINGRKLIQNIKESVEVHVFLKQNIKDSSRINLQNYIASKPYTKGIKYTDKETAKKEWVKSGGEDFTEFIDNSLLPPSIDFTLKNEFVDSAQLVNIQADIAQNPIVDEVRFPSAVVNSMMKNFRNIGIVLGVVAILIAVMVIILIDNTIRLAMFSNRFLIKTMQMVGATRWFIAKPLDMRAVFNGALSGMIATLIVYFLLLLAENFFDGFRKLHDTNMMILLGIVLIILGIGITVFSTHRSVLKYLRMKLDDLY